MDYKRNNTFAFKTLDDLKLFFKKDVVNINEIIKEARDSFKIRFGEEDIAEFQLIRKVEILILRRLRE